MPLTRNDVWTFCAFCFMLSVTFTHALSRDCENLRNRCGNWPDLTTVTRLMEDMDTKYLIRNDTITKRLVTQCNLLEELRRCAGPSDVEKSCLYQEAKSVYSESLPRDTLRDDAARMWALAINLETFSTICWLELPAKILENAMCLADSLTLNPQLNLAFDRIDQVVRTARDDHCKVLNCAAVETILRYGVSLPTRMCGQRLAPIMFYYTLAVLRANRNYEYNCELQQPVYYVTPLEDLPPLFQLSDQFETVCQLFYMPKPAIIGTERPRIIDGDIFTKARDTTIITSRPTSPSTTSQPERTTDSSLITSDGAPWLTDPSQVIYTNLGGNCKGNAISGLWTDISFEICANRCTSNPTCAGISFWSEGGCYLKSNSCNRPVVDAVYTFYRKDQTRQG